MSPMLGDANGNSYVSSLDLTKVERIVVGLDAGSTAHAYISSPIAHSAEILFPQVGDIIVSPKRLSSSLRAQISRRGRKEESERAG